MAIIWLTYNRASYYNLIELISTFCENNPILRKCDLFLTPCGLKFDLIKKVSEYFW